MTLASSGEPSLEKEFALEPDGVHAIWKKKKKGNFYFKICICFFGGSDFSTLTFFSGDGVALYCSAPAGGKVQYQELVVKVTVLNLEAAEIVFDKFPTGPLSGDVFADDKGIHVFNIYKQNFRLLRVRGHVEWSGSGNPEAVLKLKRGRLKVNQCIELPIAKTTSSTVAKQVETFDIGLEDRSKNRIWEEGSAGQVVSEIEFHKGFLLLLSLSHTIP